MKWDLKVGGLTLVLSLGLFEVHGEFSPPSGYTSRHMDLSVSVWFGGFDYLPDGRLIVSDSEDVFILDEEAATTVVAHFKTPGLFGSFVKVAPDEQTVYVGESSLGTISKFVIKAGDIQSIGPETDSVIAEVPMAYDMEFGPEGKAFLSAPVPDTLTPANGLYLLDTETGETDLIAWAGMYSGPLAFDGEGNLVYCTATAYPPEPVESLLVFQRDQIDLGIGEAVLLESDAQLLASDIYGFSDMAFDDEGRLFGVTSSGEILGLSWDQGNLSSREFGSTSPNGITVVRFRPGTRHFQPYHQDGGTLTFLESDFWSLFRLLSVTPFPEFKVISLSPDQDGTNVRFATEEGKQYQVYGSNDLTDEAGWQPLGPLVTGNGEPQAVLDQAASEPGGLSPGHYSQRQRFYRVQNLQ
jgi:hypothetical protein